MGHSGRGGGHLMGGVGRLTTEMEMRSGPRERKEKVRSVHVVHTNAILMQPSLPNLLCVHTHEPTPKTKVRRILEVVKEARISVAMICSEIHIWVG